MRQEVVLFAEDWDSGAAAWSAQRHETYANDPGAATRSNQSRSDQAPAEGLPPASEAHCRYVGEWVGTKLRWGLSAYEAEVAALREVADGCPEQTVTYERRRAQK